VDEAALERQLAGQMLDQRLATMKAHDEAFDRQEFLKRAQGIVVGMAAACRKGSLDDQAGEIFEGRFAAWKAGFIDTPYAHELAGENLTVNGLTIAGVGLGLMLNAIINEVNPDNATYDAITVRVDAESDAEEPFTEYWIFIRRVADGATAAPQTGQCPNCGAPLSLNAMGACDYCGADLALHADSTWALAEITNVQLPPADTERLPTGWSIPAVRQRLKSWRPQGQPQEWITEATG